MFDINGLYEACVLVNGRAVTEVDHNGSTFIEGRSGSDYELHFTNRTATKIMVVPSVDGLNVIDGKPCGTESSGYIVMPFGSIVIPGWKVDGSTAARFQFRPRGGPTRSTYAEAITESEENQGVIGFIVFQEKPAYVAPQPFPSWTSNKFPDPFYGPPGTYGGPDGWSSGGGTTVRSASINSSNDGYNVSYAASEVGTGFGNATDFNTHETKFERVSSFPDATLVMYYDTLKGLAKRGVPVDKFKYHGTEPNPFPASPSIHSGCKPPHGWKK